jgi:diguanylate cyclase (GGDEF)-like protein
VLDQPAATPEIASAAGQQSPSVSAHSESLQQSVVIPPDQIGCSKLCFVLAGIGLGLSCATGLFTYSLLHEQQEALGEAVIEHIASSTCTAINSTMAALAVTRSDVLHGDPEQAPIQPDWPAAVGVLNAGNGELEDVHTGGLSAAQVIASLRRLPRGSLEPLTRSPIATALDRAPSSLRQELGAHGCSFGYGLTPESVRIHSIANPAGEASASGDGPWFALLYGPWSQGGRQKTAFALVDLNAITFGASGHDRHGHDIQALFHGGRGRLEMEVGLSPASALSNKLILHRAMPGLHAQDHKLLSLRIIPFANQILRAELSVDHRQLNRMARRTAAFVFLMGLLATSAVVLISRRAELKLRQLNQALQQESRTDGLTRLANRRAWDEALQREESRRQRYGNSYGILVVDLDGFKRVNDELGHQVGDRLLQTAAAGMAAVLREADLLARVGGDEFAVLSFNPTPQGLSGLSKRLQRALEQAGIHGSIGAALSREQATLEQTWAEADGAMYRCKSGSAAADPAETDNLSARHPIAESP